MSVSERWLTMGEIVEAGKEGRVSADHCVCIATGRVTYHMELAHLPVVDAVMVSGYARIAVVL